MAGVCGRRRHSPDRGSNRWRGELDSVAESRRPLTSDARVIELDAVDPSEWRWCHASEEGHGVWVPEGEYRALLIDARTYPFEGNEYNLEDPPVP